MRHKEHGGSESGSRQGCKHVTPTSAGSSVWRCQGRAGKSEHRFSSAFEWTGHRTAGKWELAGTFIKRPNKPTFFSLAAIKGRKLNQNLCSKLLSPGRVAGTCPQPALLDGSDFGLGKTSQGRGRNARQLCPSPATDGAQGNRLPGVCPSPPNSSQGGGGKPRMSRGTLLAENR